VATDRIQYLDVGRAIAALIVVEHHTMVYFGTQIAAALGQGSIAFAVLSVVSDLNLYAVLFFFFISGWCIRLSLGKAAGGDGATDWWVYLGQRARRILPIYWISIVWAYGFAVAAGTTTLDTSAPTLLGNLAFLQTTAPGGWIVPFAGNGPVWSLALEAWYYISLPLVSLALLPVLDTRLKRPVMGLSASLAVGIGAIVLNKLTPSFFIAIWILASIWYAGFLFASCESAAEQWRAFMTLIGLTALMMIGMRLVKSDSLFQLAGGYAIGTGIAAIAVAGRAGWFDTMPRSKMADAVAAHFAWLGQGSYAVYVLHYPIILFFAERTGGAGVIAVIASLAALVWLAPLFERGVQSAVNRRIVLGPIERRRTLRSVGL
jgi:peptidoglycan/LPS O-acetylase OafA/YrhL